MSKNLEITPLLDFYGQLLTQKQRDIMELYYYDDLSLAEISENEHITRQGVHDSIKRSEQILTDYENKLSLAEKFSSLEILLREISQKSDVICMESQNSDADFQKIYDCSCNIKEIIDKIYNFI